MWNSSFPLGAALLLVLAAYVLYPRKRRVAYLLLAMSFALVTVLALSVADIAWLR